MRPAPLLAVADLRVVFAGDRRGDTQAVAGISFSIAPGRTLGIVGESGCGKSVTALAIMRLLDGSAARLSGSIVFEGLELLSLPARQMRDLRGNRIAMIFQEPMTSLNPSFTIGDQIGEVLMRHRGLSARVARDAAIAMLERVRIPSPSVRVDDYPHKLSGGMRQRAMIAMALACDPKLVIADEPTTALDVAIQAQILDLLRELSAASGTAILLITHDLGVVAELADEVLVMYAGKVVERAPVKALFEAPQHPYTIGLLGSIPRLDGEEKRLAAIDGAVPNVQSMPHGCRFHPRCPFAIARCREEEPPLGPVAPGQFAACWRAPLEEAAS